MLDGIAKSDSAYCVTIAWSVHLLSMCVFPVTLVYPAEVIGWNKMPFGTDTRMVSCSIVLDRGFCPLQEGEIWGSESPVCSDPQFGHCLQLSWSLTSASSS